MNRKLGGVLVSAILCAPLMLTTVARAQTDTSSLNNDKRIDPNTGRLRQNDSGAASATPAATPGTGGFYDRLDSSPANTGTYGGGGFGNTEGATGAGGKPGEGKGTKPTVDLQRANGIDNDVGKPTGANTSGAGALGSSTGGTKRAHGGK